MLQLWSPATGNGISIFIHILLRCFLQRCQVWVVLLAGLDHDRQTCHIPTLPWTPNTWCGGSWVHEAHPKRDDHILPWGDSTTCRVTILLKRVVDGEMDVSKQCDLFVRLVLSNVTSRIIMALESLFYAHWGVSPLFMSYFLDVIRGWFFVKAIYTCYTLTQVLRVWTIELLYLEPKNYTLSEWWAHHHVLIRSSI